MSNRNRLDVGIMEKNTSAISQLSDKGVSVYRAHRITYVWLLTWADFQNIAIRAPTAVHYLRLLQHGSALRPPPGTLRRQAHRYRQDAVR